MPTRQKRLALAAGVFLFIVTLGWNLFSDATRAPASVAPPASDPAHNTEASGTPTPVTAPVANTAEDARRLEYAIAVTELDGLSPDAVPGSAFDLWVTWEPPLVDQPDVELLLEAVRLQRIIPPVIPEGPTVAVLSIPRAKAAVELMIYGDQYGRLSVVSDARTGL